MGILRGRHILLNRIRYHGNYYSYLGVRYNAPGDEISAAINFRKTQILENLQTAENEMELKRALVMLKKMQKILTNDELRKKYNFQERESIADTIPEIHQGTKHLLV